MIGLLLAACAEPPAAPSPAPPPPVEVAAPVPAAAPPVDPAVAPIALTFTWQNLSPLHRDVLLRYKNELGRGLAGHLAPPGHVAVSYDAVAVRGEIALQVSPAALSHPPSMAGDLADLRPLVPLTQALGAYRRAVSRLDMRFTNFHLAIEMGTCRFAAAEVAPFDGGQLDPCVSIDGAVVCGEVAGERLRFAPAGALTACLR